MTNAPCPSLAGKTILIAEDYWLLADLIRQAVTDAGGKVAGPTGSLVEAERLAATICIDAAVLDLNLRGGQSNDLARRLAAQGKTVVVLSGNEAPAHLAEVVDQCFTKPVSSADLIAALARRQARESG